MPHYETISEPQYETIKDVYSKKKPAHADLTKYNWFHGNISEEQANVALQCEKHNNFLVRGSIHSLILSKKSNGWKSHDIIHHSPEGYRLEGKEEVFKNVPEMIAHYQQFPIHKDRILGKAIDKGTACTQASTGFVLFCAI